MIVTAFKTNICYIFFSLLNDNHFKHFIWRHVKHNWIGYFNAAAAINQKTRQRVFFNIMKIIISPSLKLDWSPVIYLMQFSFAQIFCYLISVTKLFYCYKLLNRFFVANVKCRQKISKSFTYQIFIDNSVNNWCDFSI